VFGIPNETLIIIVEAVTSSIRNHFISWSRLIVLLFYVLVLSSKCYVCTATDGNCKTGEQDCGALDMCIKMKVGKVVTKSCGNKASCDITTAACKKVKDCTTACCKGNLCNASSSLKSITMLTFVAPLMAVARYLM
jgi:hypothetical protein